MTKGDRFGKLTAIKFNHYDKFSQQLWLFKCDCGNEKVIRVGSIKSGNTKSCGCYRKQNKSNFKHGMSYTRTYRSWRTMKQRCLNKNSPNYKYYGGRGIGISEYWIKSFENFYSDMGERPEGLSLDRINNNGDYYLENCKWATPNEQCNNKRGLKE